MNRNIQSAIQMNGKDGQPPSLLSDCRDYGKRRFFFLTGSIFLFAVTLLTYIGQMPREISHSVQLTMMPLALLCLFRSLFGRIRDYQRATIWCALYLIWNVITIVRGGTAEYFPWKNDMQIWIVFLSPLYVGLLLPLVCFMQFNATKTFLFFVRIMILVSFVLMIVNFRLFFNISNLRDDYVLKCNAFATLFSTVWIAMLPIFCRKLFHFRDYCLSWIATILCFLISLILVRRGAALSLSIVLLAGFYLSSMRKNIKVFICILLVVGSQFFFTTNIDGIKKNYDERGDLMDSRQGLVEKILEEPSADVVIFGKGMFGSYYYEDFFFDEKLQERVGLRRFSAESGCLDIILRGGIIALILHCLALGGAVVYGLFRSRSKIAKGMAFYVLMAILELIPFGLQTFSLRLIMVWIFASMLYSKSFCALSDREILERIRRNEI